MTAIATEVVTSGRRRRNAELGLGFLAVVVTVGGYILLALANGPKLPPDLAGLLVGIVLLYVAAHLAVRRLAPNADGTLLPIAALLNGLGFVTIARIDGGLTAQGSPSHLARIQSVWSAVGVGAFILTLLVVRHIRTLERYTYTFALIALGLLLVPLLPHIGLTVNGARIWAHFGPLHFQPGEPAKVLWVAFFAGYLTQKREFLKQGSRSVGRLRLPAARHLGPLVATWGVSILVLVFEKDLGSSLLFFAVFAAMLYMATERSAYLIGSFALFSVGAVTAYHLFAHVRDRVQGWLNPWPYRLGPKGFQIIQSWYAFAAGGVAGKGIGLGVAYRIPYASTDFVFAAFAEELGLIGTFALVACFLLIIGSGYRIAIESTRPFSKLFAAGLTTILGLQTFIIIGGVTRIIPLTGITLPFVSYGGSSLVANFVILALLLRMSDESERDRIARVNTAIRRVGIVVIGLFVAIAAQLTYLQLVRAPSLNADPANVRNTTQEISRNRGDIVTADGYVVARSTPVTDELKYQRQYPLGSLFSNVVGYQAVNLGSTGVEREYNSELIGHDLKLQTHSLSDLLSTHTPTGTVVLTLSKTAQEAAKAALNGRRGSVTVIDVQTGGIVAMYSNPTFDPKPLASHDTALAQKTFNALEANPIHPDLPRAYRERYPAGSTFKVITSAVGLEDGVVQPNTMFPRLTNIALPQSDKTLSNFGFPPERCGGTLAESFTVSCNTTFARVGLTLGDRLAEGALKFGINAGAPPIDLSPGAASSVGPAAGTFKNNMPFFAYEGIGQGSVAVTPLEMAMVAQSVANHGVMLVPHVMSEIRASDGTVVRQYEPKVWKTTMTPATAATLTGFMETVVSSPDGTGKSARIAGITVAGKTGTAQSPPGAPHAWFIAFAPAEAPKYAISVIIERGGDEGSEATGGKVAAPVAAQVLSALLKAPANG